MSRTECCFVAAFYKIVVIARVVDRNATWFVQKRFEKRTGLKPTGLKTETSLHSLSCFFVLFKVKPWRKFRFSGNVSLSPVNSAMEDVSENWFVSERKEDHRIPFHNNAIALSSIGCSRYSSIIVVVFIVVVFERSSIVMMSEAFL